MDHRWIARIAVAALHLGLLAALWMHKPQSLGEHDDRRLTTVRLIAAPPQRVPQPPAAPKPAVPRETERRVMPPPSVTIVPPAAPETAAAQVTIHPPTATPSGRRRR